MSPASSGEISRLLSAPLNASVFSKLVSITYPELRHIAAHYFRSEPPGHTLQPTALVHEVYLRLARKLPQRFENRAHYFGTLSRAMRQILVDAARRHRAEVHGGGMQRVSLERAFLPSTPPDYLAIDQALTRLEAVDSRMARIVELHFFGGFSHLEIAHLLHMGESTVREEWSIAKVWLQQALGEPQP